MLLNSLNLWMLERSATKGLGADFFFSIIEEFWLLDNSENIWRNFAAFESDFLAIFELFLLSCGNVMSNWNRQNVLLSISIGDGIHVHRFEKLLLVHKSLEWVSPSLSNGVEVVDLFEIFNF